TAIFIQNIVDHVIVDNNYKFLNLMAFGMILVLLLRVGIDVLKNVFILRTGQLIDTRLILGYYKHLLKLPQQFFDTMRVGEITSRVSDAVKIRLFINDISINLIVSISMLISSLALMFTYYWKLALAMLLTVPVYSLIYFITNMLNKRAQRKLMEDSAELESQLLESLNAIGTIKRFSLEQYSNDKTESRFIVLLKTIYRSGMNSLFSGASTEFTSQLFVIILLWVGSGYVLNRQISPGELLSFYTLIAYFTGPITSLIGMNKVVQDALIASDRLFEVMDLERETETNENQIKLTPQNIGNIRFSRLSFRYGTGVDVFSNLDLDIPLKRMTAIVGESGCGKSSLVSLLQNIYPFYSGNIYFGVNSIKYVTNTSLREIVAVVPQVTDLFSGSILSNITIGREEIDMQKVLKICIQLGIIDFIDKLSDGFQTNIGENGVALSGGFRQRIAIARALYRDPEILILDEATSSLDPLSENHVLDTIANFLEKGKTVIVIAHRLSTIQRADKIIVFKNGRVEEEGTHSELIARRSEYYSLWTKHLPRDIDFPAYEIA
ncbi:peptidase domain-containing ABC transporter, partial [Daejeonella sp.]|uniref:peptidase domain-containing ABC transporter n=1 Tax=Daejeonella sp. TaxID=2805397 RepID=UPI0030C4C01B